MCQLCGKKVRTDVVVPHPLAATIDHVIPLARGGRHEMSNVQTAHFLCNSLKGDRPSSPRPSA
ncbi:HNH endonuclease [Amycolatopsis sp. lyj-84]|uniref:HNH endonuclease n=1 Tax=Amycolatopsis sp. lyj-84 TaxID=2789284 RepID=UPI00397A24DA